jgi:geranylgeranyl diphosphate synthase type II
MKEIKKRLADRAKEVDAVLGRCLYDKGVPEVLKPSMEYSLMAGGKRLRPVLCSVWAEMLGMDRGQVLEFAAGLELIHTYSLVHDDLPAMDDDDLRRGKPSNHKKFGEATAILAGDGLLTEAFSMMLESNLPAERVVRAAVAVARGAGPSGMVGGQAVDMDYTGRSDGVSLEELRTMHAMKTGALITSACVSGAILAGTGPEDEKRAREYGANIGVAFQIADDVLDVIGDQELLGKPVGSDEGSGKTTYPALVGLDESRRLADEAAEAAVAALDAYAGPQANFLAELARYIVDRVN